MSGVIPDPRGAGEQRHPHGSDWPSIREAGRKPDGARIRRATAGSKWLGTAQANAPVTHRYNEQAPTRIAGPAQNGNEPRRVVVSRYPRRSKWLRWIRDGPTATQNGRQERGNRHAALRGGTPDESRIRLGTRGRYTEQVPTAWAWSAGLPEKPTPPGKPADTLTQARWSGG